MITWILIGGVLSGAGLFALILILAPPAAQPAAVWITSAEQVRLLFAAAPASLTQQLQSLLYFTHHQRVAEALRAAGATRVELIPALDIDTLNRYAEQNR